MPKVATMADKYNLDITISLDYVPEEYDYNLILVDKFSRLLGVGKSNGPGGKSITIPNWCLKDEVYTLKVQTLDGSEVISEESYDLSFRENTLHMEYMRMQQALGFSGGMNFNYSLRKKLWEKQTKNLGREVSVFQRSRYEEKYLEQMDAVYCDVQEFFA